LLAEDFTVEWPNARLRIRGGAVAQRGELLRLVFLNRGRSRGRCWRRLAPAVIAVAPAAAGA
jgi:hypothetical protein